MSATPPTFSKTFRPFPRYISLCCSSLVRWIGRMAGLQRSAQTFRRSGSSGLVWDERFLTEGAGAAAGRQQPPELRHSRSVGSVAVLRLGGSAADRDDKKRKLVLLAKPNHKDHHHKKQEEQLVVPGRKAFRTRDVAPLAAEPPSPRVPAGCCAHCAIFRDAARAGGSSSLPRRAKKR